MRQLQVGGGKAMSFGKSKAKLLSENQKKMTFADVAGIEEAKDEVEEIIAFLKDPKKFTRLGGRIPKGVLMMGPPGTGKTLLARAIAGEAGVPFFSISGSDFVEMFVGVGASRVRDLFEQGKKNAPCIIFIDEIDAVGRHRGAGLGGGHDEREQTLNQLLVEMDGFESNDGVILIAATNRPDVLDPALLRPGRFDRRIVVPRPDVKGRTGILKVHTKKTPLAAGRRPRRRSPAARPASRAPISRTWSTRRRCWRRAPTRTSSTWHDFEMAKDKVLMGPERRSMIISDNDKRVTAYHEAGHALVGKMMKGSDPVHKVTIIPRGRALGLTQQLPVEDRLNLSKDGGQRPDRGGHGRPRRRGARSSGRSRPAPPTTSRWRPIWRARWSATGACPTSSGRCTSASARTRSSWAATSPTQQGLQRADRASRSTPRCARIVTDELRARQAGRDRQPRQAEGAGRGAAGVRDRSTAPRSTRSSRAGGSTEAAARDHFAEPVQELGGNSRHSAPRPRRLPAAGANAREGLVAHLVVPGRPRAEQRNGDGESCRPLPIFRLCSLSSLLVQFRQTDRHRA